MRSQSMEPPIAMSLDRYALDVLRVGKKLRTVALLCCYMDCKPCRQLDVPTHTHTHMCLVLLCMQHMVVICWLVPCLSLHHQLARGRENMLAFKHCAAYSRKDMERWQESKVFGSGQIRIPCVALPTPSHQKAHKNAKAR